MILLSIYLSNRHKNISICVPDMTQNVYKMRSFLCRRCFFRVMFFSDDLVILLELLICYIIRSGAALVSLWTGPEVDEDCRRAGDGGY